MPDTSGSPMSFLSSQCDWRKMCEIFYQAKTYQLMFKNTKLQKNNGNKFFNFKNALDY